MKRNLSGLLLLCMILSLLPPFVSFLHPQTDQATGKKLININAASIEELTALPGIGVKTAERIVLYRKAHGKFKKIEDLMNVKGIGEKKFLRLRHLITVGEKVEVKSGD